MRLDEAQRETLHDSLAALDQHDIRYVILRGHRELPQALAGSDVDLFVDPAGFEDALTLFDHLLDPAESTLRGLFDLAVLGARHPRRAVEMAVGSPHDAGQYVMKSLRTTEFGDRKYEERSFRDGELVFHLVNHLAYTSTLDGTMVRVDPQIEAWMLDNRLSQEWFYIPEKPDELAHLICRGVFDYEGEFPDRYHTRCDELFAAISQHDRLIERLRTLLGSLFYDADDLAYELLAEGDYDSLRRRLRCYANY